jgi:hypothetical protein
VAGFVAHATGVEAHINDALLDLGHTPLVTVVEQKTAFGTPRVLAQVALCPAPGFAAFDDLLAVAVGTLDRDEGHGPLLAFGGYQDEAQCDINRSPSPLLEHYRGEDPERIFDRIGLAPDSRKEAHEVYARLARRGI